MTSVPPKRTPQPEQDPPPFPVLFRTYRGVIARALRSMGVAERHVEEATQDVFLIVLRKLPAYEPRGNLFTWIFGIAKNIAAEHRRRESQSPLASEDVPPLADAAAHGEDSIAACDLLARLLAVIAEDDHRHAFVLYHLEAWTMPEIGQLFSVPPTTIKSWIARAQRDVEAAARRLHAHDRHTTGAAVVPLFGTAALFETLRAIPSLPDTILDRIGARLMQAPELRARHGEDSDAPLRRKTVPAWAAGPLVALGIALGLMWAPLHEPARAPLVTKADSDATAPRAVALPVPSPVPALTASSRTDSQESATVAPSAVHDSEPELDLIHEAEVALASGDVTKAMARLDAHARKFGARNAAWREVTHIRVLLRAGRLGEARERIERFARSHPNDPRLGAWRKAAGLDPAP
jgi:RNA polymerase sigma-70 factor, ECF subfamily